MARESGLVHAFVRVALDEGYGDAEELAGDQFGGCGQLVGDGDGGGPG